MESSKIELEQVQEFIKTLDSVRSILEDFSNEKSIGVQRDILSAIRKLNEMYVDSKTPIDTNSARE
jgi:hypothetical protein